MISLSLYRLSFASSPLPGTHFVDAPGWALKSIRSDRSNRFAFKFRERGERTWKRERGSLIIPLKHWRNSPGESSLRINRPSNQPAYESISLRINRRLLIATVCLVTLLLKCIVWVACSRGARSCTAHQFEATSMLTMVNIRTDCYRRPIVPTTNCTDRILL